MTQRRIILVSVVFFSITVFTVQTLPRTPSSNRILKPPNAERLRNMTEEERKKLAEMMLKQKKLEIKQRLKEFRKKSAEHRRRWELGGEQRKLEHEQRRKERDKKKEEAGGFIFEKNALGATEEQWKVIKPKLEKVRHLREQANSMVGLSLINSSGSRSVPTWKWRIRWKDKSTGKLTEAQKLANELLDLVDSKNAKAEAFRRKMDALRKARSEQSQLKKQLSEARQELREVLTTRQEAALVLMYWL